MLDPKAFKAYDVRGLYGTELDEDGAYRIGRAYVDEFRPTRIAIRHPAFRNQQLTGLALAVG